MAFLGTNQFLARSKHGLAGAMSLLLQMVDRRLSGYFEGCRCVSAAIEFIIHEIISFGVGMS